MYGKPLALALRAAQRPSDAGADRHTHRNTDADVVHGNAERYTDANTNRDAKGNCGAYVVTHGRVQARSR